MATAGINDVESGRDETFDFLCVVCKGKNKNTEAEMFCSDCHDYYCSSCIKCHDVIPALKPHQILDKSTAPLPAVPTDRCKDHKDKPVDMLCSNHNAVGCSTCMLKKHTSCKDKFYIPDVITTDNKVFDSVKEKLGSTFNSLLKSLLEFQKALIKEKEELKSNKDNVLKEIGTFRNKINQQLDQFEKNIIQELEQSFKYFNDQIDSSFGEFRSSTTEIKALQEKLKLSGRNSPQKFVSMMLSPQVVSSTREKMETSESQISFTEIDFLVNKKLQTMFSEIQDLGSIRVREKLRITGRQEYPVRLKYYPNTCGITSACELNDGTIILVDESNSKLKRLASPSYIVTDFCDVYGKPTQLCVVSDKEVAVSCWEYQIIQFVTVEMKMEKTREIETGSKVIKLSMETSLKSQASDWLKWRQVAISANQMLEI